MTRLHLPDSLSIQTEIIQRLGELIMAGVSGVSSVDTAMYQAQQSVGTRLYQENEQNNKKASDPLTKTTAERNAEAGEPDEE